MSPHSPATVSDSPDSRLTPLLRGRWSPRAFDPDHALAPSELALLLEAARWAPSAGNAQPWAFLVGRRGDPTCTAFHALLSRGNTVWGGRASALIVTLHRTAIDPGTDVPYSDYAAYDLGQAVAQLVVQAQAMGLHAHQFAGFDHAAATKQFGVPPHWRVTTGIALGRLAPAETLEPALAERERQPRQRRALAEIAFAGRFGRPARLG